MDGSRGFRAGPPFMLHPAIPESLYGVCILELVDHLLAQDRPYRICANETCGELFSVQEGHPTSGRHRTEKVKYHTRNCKDAQEPSVSGDAVRPPGRRSRERTCGEEARAVLRRPGARP